MNYRLFTPLLGALTFVLLDAGSIHAFYWRDWPGSGTTTSTASVVSTTTATTTATTTTTNPTNTGTDPEVTDPVVEDPDVNDPVDPNAGHAPEPATLIGGLIGLGMVVLLGGRRLLAHQAAMRTCLER